MGDHYPNTLKVKDQNLQKCVIPGKKNLLLRTWKYRG